MVNVYQSIIVVMKIHIVVSIITILKKKTQLYHLNLDDGADEPFDCLNVTCPYEYFKCPSTGKCIPLEKVCDNFDDCPAMDRTNGISEDETSQACSKNSFFILHLLFYYS